MFCPRCDTQLAYGARNCPTCNSKVDIRANPGTLHPLGERAKFDMARPKMAVFDIDMTLLDTSSKDRAAIRAGVIDPKGKKLFPKGEAAYDRYMSTPIKRLRTDKPFPGAVNFVKNLMGRGYSIAYVTARPKKIRQNTIEQLESFGFPVFYDYDGSNMVFHKSANDVAEYKLNKLKELSKRYDIDYFFDDLESNRKAAESLGIPGVFDLRERLGVAASNPPTGGLKDVSRANPKVKTPIYGTSWEITDEEGDILAEAYRNYNDVIIGKKALEFGRFGKVKIPTSFDEVETPSDIVTSAIREGDFYSEGYFPMFFTSVLSALTAMKIQAGDKSIRIKSGYHSSGYRTWAEPMVNTTAYHLIERQLDEGQDIYDFIFDTDFTDMDYKVSQICKNKDGFYLWDGSTRTPFDSISYAKLLGGKGQFNVNHSSGNDKIFDLNIGLFWVKDSLKVIAISYDINKDEVRSNPLPKPRK